MPTDSLLSQFSPEERRLIEESLLSFEDRWKLSSEEQDDSTDTTIGGLLGQFAGGFLHGATTINPNDEPTNTAEGIAHSLGAVAGFMGLLINPAGVAARLGLSGALLGARTAALAANTAKTAPLFLRIGSVPTHTAAWAMRGLRGAIEGSTLSKEVAWLSKTSFARDIGEGALELGIAGAVGAAPPWRLAVDERLDAFWGMAQFGALNRVMGNYISPGGKWDASKFNTNASREERILMNNIARSAASGIAMGLPSTLRGDPTEIQVYEYVLNAVFGYHELPLHVRLAKEKMDPFTRNPEREDKLWEPEKNIPGWDALPAETKAEIEYESTRRFGRVLDGRTILAKAEQRVREAAAKHGSDPYPNDLTDELVRSINDVPIGEKTEIQTAGTNAIVAEHFYTQELATELRKDQPIEQAQIAAASRAKRKAAHYISTVVRPARQAAIDETGKPVLTSERLGYYGLRSQMMDLADQRGLVREFVGSAERVIKEIVPKETELADKRTAWEQFIGKAVEAKDTKKPKMAAFDDYVAELRKTYDINETQERSLRDAWFRTATQSVYTRISVDYRNSATPVVRLHSSYDENGRPDETLRPTSPFEEATGQRVFILNKVFERNGEIIDALSSTTSVHKLIEDVEINTGMRFVGGRKDNSQLFFVEPALELVDATGSKLSFKLKDGNTWDFDLEQAREVMPTFDADLDRLVTRRQRIKSGGEIRRVADPIESANARTFWSGRPQKPQEGEPVFDDTGILLELADRLRGDVGKGDPSSYNGEGDIIVTVGRSDKGSRALRSDVAHVIDMAVENGRAVHVYDVKTNDAVVDYVTERGGTVIIHDKVERGYGRGISRKPRSLAAVNAADVKFDLLTRIAEQAYYWEKLNSGMPLRDILKLSGNTLTDPFKLNQRNQVLFGTDVRVEDYSLFDDLKDIVTGEKRAVRGFITKIDSDDPDGIRMWRHLEGDRYEQYPVDTHLDGVMFLRSDLFDKLAEYQGIGGVEKSKSTGVKTRVGLIKGTVVDSNPTEGLLLGKLAFHRADAQLDRHLFRIGAHYHMYDTAAKSYGGRRATTVRYENGSYTYGDPNAISTINLDGFRLNPTTREGVKMVEPTEALRQLYTHLPPELAKIWMDEIVNPAIDGKDGATNVDEVSLQRVLDVTYGKKSSPEEFHKFWSHILSKKTAEEEVLDADGESSIYEMGQLESAASSIIRNAEKLTPQIIFGHPMVRTYAERRLQSYLVNRAERPVIPGSLSLYSRGYSQGLHAQHKLEPGEYLLTKALRDYPVDFEGESTTLGELFDSLDTLPVGTEGRAKAERTLMHTIIRVPADSVSGIRRLRLKGFVDAEGIEAILHPEDMKNLGGMDQDGDKISVFTKLPKEIEDFYALPEVRDQWMKFGPNGEKVFVDSHDEGLVYENPLKYRDHMQLAMFDPLTMAEVNRQAYIGNRNLGGVLNYTSAALAALRSTDNGSESIRRLMAQITEFQRNAVNKSADAAKAGKPMLPLSVIRKNVDGILGISSGRQDALGTILHNFSQLPRIIRGRSEDGKPLGLQDMLQKLRDNSEMAKTTRQLIAKEVGALEAPERESYDWITSRGLSSLYDAARRFINESDSFLTRTGLFRFALGVRGAPRGLNLNHPTFTYRYIDRETGLEVPADVAVKRDKDGALTPFVTDMHRYLRIERSEADKVKFRDELVFQDVSDITSALNQGQVNAAALKAGVSLERIKEVMELAGKLKSADLASVRAIRQATRARKEAEGPLPYYVGRDESVKAIVEAARELTPEEQNVFYAHLLGSMKVQKESLQTTLRIAQDRQSQLKAKLDRLNQIPPEAADEAMLGAIATLNNEIKQLEPEIVKRHWYESNMARSMWELPFVPDAAKRQWLSMYDQVLGGAAKGRASQTIRKIVDGVSHTGKFERVTTTVLSTSLEDMDAATAEAAKELKVDPPKSAAEAIAEDAQRVMPKVEELDTASRVPEEVKRVVRSWSEQIGQFKDGEYSPEIAAEAKELEDMMVDIMTRYPQLVSRGSTFLSGIVYKMTGVAGRAPERFTLEDVRRVGEYFRYNRKFWHENVGHKEGRKVLKRHMFWLPENIDQWMLPGDVNVLTEREVPVVTAEGVLMQPVRYFTSHSGLLFKAGRSVHTTAQYAVAREHKAIADALVDLEHLDAIEKGLAGEVFELAVRRREASFPTTSDDMRNQLTALWAEKLPRYQELRGRVVELPTREGQPARKITIEQLVDELNTKMDGFFVAERENWLRNPQGEQKYFVYDHSVGSYKRLNVQKTISNMMVDILNDVVPNVGLDGMYRLSRQIAVDMIVPRFWVGKPVREYRDVANPKTGGVERMPMPLTEQELVTWQNIVRGAVAQKFGLKPEEVGPADAENGYVYASRPLAKLSPEARKTAEEYLLSRQLPDGTMPFEWMIHDSGWVDKIDQTGYFPHVDMPETERIGFFKKKLEQMNLLKYLPAKMMREQWGYIYKTAKGQEYDEGLGQHVAEMFEGLAKAQNVDVENWSEQHDLLRSFGLRVVPGSLKGRNTDEIGLIPGWNTSPRALRKHIEKTVSAYHNTLFAVIGNKVVASFLEKKPFGAQTMGWANFMKQYIRSSLGYPSTVPKEFLENKDFREASSFYRKVYSDEAVIDIIRRWDANYFAPETAKKNLKFLKDYEAWKVKIQDVVESGGEVKVTAKQQASLDKRVAAAKEEILKLGREEAVTRKIAAVSALEGKWQLMSLLSMTKTFINNTIGGTANAAMLNGVQNYFRASNVNNVRAKLGPHVTKEWMREFAWAHGAGETMLKNEVTLNPAVRGTALGEAVREIREAFKDKSYIENGSLSTRAMEILRKHGVTDAVVEKSAWFMKASEEGNRLRAWWAGYMKARDVLFANKTSFKDDDPWLIKMANKSVEASQFLYHTASRPMFMQTALGKIWHRFQIYGLRSVALRQSVYREAQKNGWQEDSEQTRRFERFMLADLFVLSAATLFPATLFDSNLAEPWGTLSSVSEFLFGDEKEKERAFYGTLPYPANILQPFLPPASRVPVGAFNSLLSGDWDRFANYTVWTAFPMGRLGVGIERTLSDPSMVVENLIGLPIHKMDAQNTKDEKRLDEKKLYGRGVLPF